MYKGIVGKVYLESNSINLENIEKPDLEFAKEFNKYIIEIFLV